MKYHKVAYVSSTYLATGIPIVFHIYEGILDFNQVEHMHPNDDNLFNIPSKVIIK